MTQLEYLLKESSEFPKPAHTHLGLKNIQDRISKRFEDGSCKGGSCYECKNLSCKRDHDAETYIMNLYFKALGLE